MFQERSIALSLPRMVSSEHTLVATAAKGLDPAKPVDINGREIRVGFTVAYRNLVLTVSAWHRHIRDGETTWRWLLIVDPDQARDYGVYAIPLGEPDAPVEVIDPSENAPAAQPTDMLLHRLRELVSEELIAAGQEPGGDRMGTPPEWVAVFDELDYRMSRAGYPGPTQWRCS